MEKGTTMRGYYPQANPNEYTTAKWVGKTVAFNGSERRATVLAAYWQGPGKAVQLRVVELGPGELYVEEDVEVTDSEHVTIVREDR